MTLLLLLDTFRHTLTGFAGFLHSARISTLRRYKRTRRGLSSVTADTPPPAPARHCPPGPEQENLREVRVVRAVKHDRIACSVRALAIDDRTHVPFSQGKNEDSILKVEVVGQATISVQVARHLPDCNIVRLPSPVRLAAWS